MSAPHPLADLEEKMRALVALLGRHAVKEPEIGRAAAMLESDIAAKGMIMRLESERAAAERAQASEVEAAKRAHDEQADALAAKQSLRVEMASARMRGELAEAERRVLAAELAALRESTALRVAELEEEVAALLSDDRETALTLYRARVGRSSAALERAAAHRRDLEGLFARSVDASEVERARDAAVLRAAIEREELERLRLTEAQARLAKLGG